MDMLCMGNNRIPLRATEMKMSNKWPLGRTRTTWRSNERRYTEEWRERVDTNVGRMFWEIRDECRELCCKMELSDALPHLINRPLIKMQTSEPLNKLRISWAVGDADLWKASRTCTFSRGARRLLGTVTAKPQTKSLN
jgi:hypothetical protein